jgi:hypothetical protein
VPLALHCMELAALDAICRDLSVWNYVRERFRIPLSPPYSLKCREFCRLCSWKLRQIPANSRIFNFKLDRRKVFSGRLAALLRRFSLLGSLAVRFRQSHNGEWNTIRRRSIDEGRLTSLKACRHSRASVCRLMKGANSDCNLAIAIPSEEAGLNARL